MDWIIFALCGIAGGVLGGMGMGGGTVLIPLLSICFNLEQHLVQWVNLISFIPMSAVSLYFHVRNKLVKFKNVFYIIIPGTIMSVCGSMLAKQLDGVLLKKCFGGFLIVLSIFCFVNYFREKHN